MKTRLSMLIVLLLTCVATMSAQQLAFPGAQGWGRHASGGRAGSVYHVTNLKDSGAGSLRDAVSQAGRIIVFDVAGVIKLESRLVSKGNITLAGQTAPGEGITVYGDGISFTGASNIIVRYMRFRLGKHGKADDCGGIANGTNMIFDHCSFAWGQDETFSINGDGKGDLRNITLMNCIFGQGLLTHSAGGLIQADSITLYRNLYCDNSTRNNKVKGAHQYVNNIVYNWKNGCYLMGGDSSGESFANTQGNLFINGPAGGGNACTSGNSDFHLFADDNWQDKNQNGRLDAYEIPQSEYGGGPTFEPVPYAYPALDIVKANTLLETLLPTVGASLPYRDYVDCYMVDEVLSLGTEGVIISTEDNLPYGVPTTWTLWTGSDREDTDGDGMPDGWEWDNGTDPNADDAMQKADNGYANIENYINSIGDETPVDAFLRQPMLAEYRDATPTQVTVSWRDWTVGEDSFRIEMLVDGQWREVGRTTANATSHTISQGLTPGTYYDVRLSAVRGDERSAYTQLQVKTALEQVEMVDVETFDGTGDGEWLIAPTADETITLDEQKEYKTVVVRTDADVSISGQGGIGGTASLNKTGLGTLTLNTDNTYTGPTVLHQGTIAFGKLASGGQPSSLGAGLDDAQNWVWNGGTWLYTGGSASTNRSAMLYKDTELNIRNSTATVSMAGRLQGEAGFTLGGSGQLNPSSKDFFSYEGATTLSGGTLYINGTSKLWTDKVCDLGKSAKLVLAGGSFITKDANDTYADYTFPIEVVENTVSKVYFHRNCSIKSNVTGRGTVEWEVNWVREFVSGNWDGFYGRVIVNGTGASGNNGSQFLPYNGTGMRNATFMLMGNAQIVSPKNGATLYLGGLSGDKGTYLSGFDVKNAGKGTWVVGTAGTDETFRGVIDDRCQATAKGTTSIVKQGVGDWRLTGNNVYSGTTRVEQGRLIVNGQHTGKGAVTVGEDATLAGTGTLAAAVTMTDGAFLQVGDTLAADNGLTFSGGLTLSEGVTLRLNDTMAEARHYNGDEIQAFKGTVTGTFMEIVPAVPGDGQTWDVSRLYSDGILKVVGGDERPDQPQPGPGPEPKPAGESQLVCLAYGNMEAGSYDDSGVQNMLTGKENKTQNGVTNNNIGFSLVCTGNLAKAYGKDSGGKMTYDFDGVDRTGIVLSNGAQNTIFMPEDAKATELTIWSVAGSNAGSRTSYWREVAGVSYDETTATILDLGATRTEPNKTVFKLDNVADAVTFTNTGEQQIVILVIQYHLGGTAGISAVSGTPRQVEFFTLSGRRILSPVKGGIYLMRAVTASGKTVSRKVVM